MKMNGIILSPEKIEALILQGKKKTIDMPFKICYTHIVKKVLHTGCASIYSAALVYTIGKLQREQRVERLKSLMLNIGGPSIWKRGVLCRVPHSILL